MTADQPGPNRGGSRKPEVGTGAINLGTRRIAGFESQFLVLGAIGPDGAVRLLGIEDGVPPGAPVA